MTDKLILTPYNFAAWNRKMSPIIFFKENSPDLLHEVSLCIHSRQEKTTTRCITGIFRHHGGLIQCPLEIPRTSQHFGIKGLKGSPQLWSHIMPRGISFSGSRCKFFQSGLFAPLSYLFHSSAVREVHAFRHTGGPIWAYTKNLHNAWNRNNSDFFHLWICRPPSCQKWPYLHERCAQYWIE